MNNITQKIKSKNWDNRVQRPGFLQSKQIVAKAVCREIALVDNVFIFNKSNIWVENSALYDTDFTDYLFTDAFPKAFDKDKYWTKEIFNQLEKSAKDLDVLCFELKETNWNNVNKDQKLIFLKKYVDVLIDIQKYYAFAVPLTNYCERIIKENDESLLDFAVQFELLDVDRLNKSLFLIKEAQERGEKNDALIDIHVDKFGWIKTNYNIVEQYTKTDVLKEIKSDIHIFKPLDVPESKFRHIVTGLQIGIYLRNRMKELSQQIWFYYDGFAEHLAADLGISREDYLQLTYKEVISSVENNKLVVSNEEIKLRHQGFVVGMLDNEDILLTGAIVKELFNHYNNHDVQGINQFTGNIACKGFVKGIVKVVKDISSLKKLNEGDVLVTSMTTPDFIVGMKIASAFITDEGGLSCHAAIVSREMKKPCIIGTKIATKVLKDGDLVEVDANTGVVKIIKKV